MQRYLWLIVWIGTFNASANSAEILLPQNRTSYYVHESIELAITDLKSKQKVTLEIHPEKKGPKVLKYNLYGEEGTLVVFLPGGLLAPGVYSLKISDQAGPRITISSGVNPSTMLLSATVNNPRSAGANFQVGNAFSFGLFDPMGQPLRTIRGRRSPGLEVFDRAVKDNLPSLVYMYWTGYVTHKPFGSEKSWASKEMMEATRLLSMHTAQRIRRYADNILLVGTLDEPGLSWGKTPAGGMASGFPNWDEEEWYAKRGWKYTQDPASRSDSNWMKYMTIRCGIMREVNEQAKKDLKTIYPTLTFSTDLYAPHAIMDGTDPLSQQINDVPSSHVFLDWGVGKLGALSGLYLEKADDPTRKIAHAMNGQLFAEAVPQPHQRDAYRLMLNSMFAAGIYSNWWLNPTGMNTEDLAAINEPGLRLGPVFQRFTPQKHDVAVLWSFTELAMRQKDIAQREAKKKTGEQIKLMIASLPDIPGSKDKLVDINAYNIGGNYKEQVLNAHQALGRAGYPAHILHERVLEQKLKQYKTLVVVGQTFDLPKDVMQTLTAWTKNGGQIIVDATTKVTLPARLITKADFRDPQFRWTTYFNKAEKKDHPFKNNREASSYLTNFFMDDQARKATAPIKETMALTRSQPAIVTNSVHLVAEKHTAGKNALYMVINAHDKLPEIPAGQRHRLYNYAPLEATFTLKGIAKGSTVWCLEGGDWKKARKVENPMEPIKAVFEPGEMKLFLVYPESVTLKYLTALRRKHSIEVIGQTVDGPGICPVTITLLGPDGKEIHKIHRATNEEGKLVEQLAMGLNAAPGTYTVKVESPIGPVQKDLKVSWDPILPGEISTMAESCRIFDEGAIRKFLASKPNVVIAHGKMHKALAENLAKRLQAKGVKSVVKPETEAIRKVSYPRVWNPFATVWSVNKDTKQPGDLNIKQTLTLTTKPDGTTSILTADGKEVSSDWKQPGNLITIAGSGYVDYSGDREICYSPGIKIYIGGNRRPLVINGTSKEEKTDATFRNKWALPWTKLQTHVGGYQLPAQLPEAWTTAHHLIVLGDSTSSEIVAVLQAGELLPRQIDSKYPGPDRAILQFAWSPFAVEKNVIYIGGSDQKGLDAGIAGLLELQ